RIEAVARARFRPPIAAVVANANVQALAARLRPNLDLASLGALVDRVMHGVLDERLQRERRRAADERLRIDVGVDPQPPAVPQLLELEVPPRELPLLGERDDVALAVAQRVAEHVAELLHRALGLARVVPHERADGVQRVEEEVRMETAAQRVEPRNSEALL